MTSTDPTRSASGRTIPAAVAARPPGRLSRLLAALGLAVAAMVSFSALPASAAPPPLTPTLDCVTTNPDGLMTAYFGYINSGPTSSNFAVGDFNNVTPGSADRGQPTTFNVGSYPAVFGVQFLPSITPTLTWILDGSTVDASANSPQCLAGTTGPASGLTPTSATLNAVINPKGEPTSYHFDWGTSTAYGQSSDGQTTSTPEAFDGETTVTGLTPGTTYHYRVVATNPLLTTTGQDATFTTPPAPANPGAFAVTEPASELTMTSASLNGVVNPQGQTISYHFDWGTSTAYDHSTTAQTTSGADPQAVASPITGLQPNTTYHFRLVASSQSATTDGADQVFTTATSAPAGADVAVTVSGSPTRPSDRSPITYELTATDDGPATATDVTLTDPLPPDLRPLSASSSQGGCSGHRLLICQLGTLAPGAHATVTLKAIPRTASLIRNTVAVSALQPDPNTANNFATVLTRVTRAHASAAEAPRRSGHPHRRRQPRTKRTA